MIPLCVDQGIGLLPWSPLARGRLTRPWETSTTRSESDDFGRSLYDDVDRPVVDAVIALAQERHVPPAQIALAWVLAHPAVTSPIIGATRPTHLDDAVAALALRLSPEELARLEAPYRPHPVTGYAAPMGSPASLAK